MDTNSTVSKKDKEIQKKIAEERFQQLLEGVSVVVAKVDNQNILLRYYTASFEADYLILYALDRELGMSLIAKNEEVLKLLAEMENSVKKRKKLGRCSVAPYLPEFLTLLRNHLLFRSV